MKDPKIPKQLIKIQKKFEVDGKKRTGVVVKVVVANVVNGLLLLAVFYLLSQMPVIAGKIKELHSAQIAAEETADAAVINAEIDRNSEKVNELLKLYAGEQEFIEFIEVVTALKAEGVLTDVSFPGGDPVTSRSLTAIGGRGFPVVLVFRGTEEAINAGLSRVLSMPFLLLPQDAELAVEAPTEEVPGGLIMRLSVYLIVNENFASN